MSDQPIQSPEPATKVKTVPPNETIADNLFEMEQYAPLGKPLLTTLAAAFVQSLDSELARKAAHDGQLADKNAIAAEINKPVG